MTSGEITRRGFLAAAVALALPARAFSQIRVGARRGGVRFVVRDEPIDALRMPAGRTRLLPPRDAPRFNLVGLHWRGEGQLWVRTAPLAGRWSDWSPVEAEGLPDDASGEGDPDRLWKLGAPLWTEPADRVQYRLAGSVEALRAHFVWSPPRTAPRELERAAGPEILPRSFWYADESIVRAAPLYADRIGCAVIHHTAGRAPASPEESAAVVRAIEEYHVRGNGWNDIGYNFLVDPFGQVFEGRRGGTDRPVVGAHVRGFNVGSFGVAVLGNYERDPFTPAARAAVLRTLAWRLDLAHVDPASLIGYMPTGNERFSEGIPVTMRAVSGHRDLGWTTCPGSRIYTEVDSIARDASRLGLPKLYDPRVEGAVGGLVTFEARLSERRRWRVRVTNAEGRVVAKGAGRGSAVTWRWDSSGAGAGTYGYVFSAGRDVRPAVGTVGPDGASPSVAGTPPPRPGSVPHRVPRWAWELHRWQAAPRSTRGARPDAPSPPPRWYWEWHRWRIETAQVLGSR